jgi:hypothetical protein
LTSTASNKVAVFGRRLNRRTIFVYARTALLVLFCCWVAEHIVVYQLSARETLVGRPDVGLAINPRSAAAARALTNQTLLTGNSEDAAKLARQAIALSPLTPGAVRTLGILASRERDEMGADRWMSLSGALGWRDPPTQIWLADRLLSNGSYDQALQRIDALLRLGMPWPQLFPVLNQLMMIPAARKPLVSYLATMPPWRSALLRNLAGVQMQELPAHVLIIDMLHTTSAPATRAEIQPLIDRLMAIGMQRDAQALWTRAIADRALMVPGGLYDGGLRAVVFGGPQFPFEWVVAQAARDLVSAKPGRGINVSQAEDQPQRLIYQQPLLVPGHYVISAAIDGLPDFDWTVQCNIGGEDLPVMHTDNYPGGISARFTLPTGCETPIIALVVDRIAPGHTLEAEVRGVRLRLTKPE